MVVNGAQLASYSQAKESLVATSYFQEGIFLHFCASMISGLVTTIASMPVDIVKTRVQKASGNTNALVSSATACAGHRQFQHFNITPFMFLQHLEHLFGRDQKGGRFQLVEGIHALLRSSWTSHCADIHLLGTAERHVQEDAFELKTQFPSPS